MSEDVTRAGSSVGSSTLGIASEDAGSTPAPLIYPCYDKMCPNKVSEEHRWCEDCQEKNYGHKVSGMTIKQVQNRLRQMGGKRTIHAPTPSAPDLFFLSFEELKVKEKRASEYLVANKHLEKQDPEKWAKLTKRYKKVVYFLNMKTPGN